LTLVCAILVFLVLALPFIKFRLTGERHPVRVTDGAGLASASFLAAGLATVFACSVFSYSKYRGLPNERDRRTLRRLLARGLVRRQPNFVVMNETFRRFLLDRAEQCDADLPPEPGAWQAIRGPVLVLGTAVVILLFVTQQELFGATEALAAALASGVASVTRISGLFERRPGGRDAG
jgi:hypothetical protein